MADSNARQNEAYAIPEDPAGTVRCEHLGRAVAVRGFNEDGDPMWYIIDTSNHFRIDEEPPDISSWPVVFGGDV